MKKSAYYTLAVLGFVLIVVGLCALKRMDNGATGFWQVAPYFCIGIGCGALGHGLGECISRRAVKNCPDLQKEMEIAQADERNVAIGNRAKGKAYDAMIYIFGALIVSFGLMSVALPVLLILIFAYLLVVGISIYYRCKYDKEM